MTAAGPNSGKTLVRFQLILFCVGADALRILAPSDCHFLTLKTPL
jgi:hypothetical protein